MTAHTPGPWKAIGGGETIGVYTDFGDKTPISEPVHIASIWLHSTADSYANSRLIAAAPMLADLLKEARHEIYNPHGENARLLDQIDAALAKAGVTP